MSYSDRHLLYFAIDLFFKLKLFYIQRVFRALKYLNKFVNAYILDYYFVKVFNCLNNLKIIESTIYSSLSVW